MDLIFSDTASNVFHVKLAVMYAARKAYPGVYELRVWFDQLKGYHHWYVYSRRELRATLRRYKDCRRVNWFESDRHAKQHYISVEEYKKALRRLQ